MVLIHSVFNLLLLKTILSMIYNLDVIHILALTTIQLFLQSGIHQILYPYLVDLVNKIS
jgi:hypothetical protein